jgi:hypothetical protein
MVDPAPSVLFVCIIIVWGVSSVVERPVAARQVAGSTPARPSLLSCEVGDWSSGMIPASGAGGREFDSRITPFFESKKNSPYWDSNPESPAP